jgi:hypothetical protein
MIEIGPNLSEALQALFIVGGVAAFVYFLGRL